ncbi:hypothetical protein LOZ52_003604, partial [Ophidiomyces ophidiicola]
RGGFQIHHAVAGGVDVLEGGGVDGDGGFGGGGGGGGGGGRGRVVGSVVVAGSLWATSAALGDQGDAAILRVHGAVVAQQQVAADEGAAALQALEGALLGVWKS